MSEPTSTADYRKYPKPQNFGIIVALAAVVLIVAMIGGWMYLRKDARKLLPHGPNSNPTPNSLVLPLLQQSTTSHC
jgi:hypothetical protein